MRPIAGKLSDFYGEKVVIIPSLIITVLALVTLGLSTGLFGVILSAILYGVGFGSAQPRLQAAILRIVPPERAGVANASFSTATDLGIGLGAIVLGWVPQYMSYQGLFIVWSVSVVFSLLMFTFFSRRLKNNVVRSLNSTKEVGAS
jgi:MFS family permease